MSLRCSLSSRECLVSILISEFLPKSASIELSCLTYFSFSYEFNLFSSAFISTLFIDLDF